MSASVCRSASRRADTWCRLRECAVGGVVIGLLSAQSQLGPDHRLPPGLLDRINVSIGEDGTVIGRQVLQGSDAAQFDTPTQATVALAYHQYPSQITFTPGSGDHYSALARMHRLS